MDKIAIVTTHPIQYNAPLFRLLTERWRVQLKVFYSWGQTQEGPVYDPAFGKAFQWDIPLLDGYEHQFIENLSKNPGTGHFGGIVNKELIPAVEVWQPHAVLVYGWSFHSHLQALRYFKGRVPVLFRGDSTLLDEGQGFRAKKFLRRIFLHWVYHHVDTCLYTGAANKAYYVRHGIREHQLVYAPHAVDNQRFSQEHEDRNRASQEWRRELGIGASETVFLFAGKLEPKKDPVTLIKAFQSLNNDDCRLVIAGSGVLEAELRRLASGDQRIHFLPFQNQGRMPLLYRLGDVYVLPSKGPGETWGLAVNEAMACGRAVLVSDKCGGAADLVKQGENGFVFSAGDVEALAASMRQMMDRSITEKMGEKGREMIQQFSLERVAEAIEGVVSGKW